MALSLQPPPSPLATAAWLLKDGYPAGLRCMQVALQQGSARYGKFRRMSQSEANAPRDSAEAASVADERTMLAAFLDLYRDIIRRKVRGVSEADARRRLVPSMTTLGGLVKHLYWVELSWFQRVLAGRAAEDLPPVPWTDQDPDADFRMEPDETVEQLIAAYDRACAQSRAAAASRALDDTVAHHRMGQVSLRWIYLHMIEETARHAGHADILREQLDGSTGD